MFKIIFNLCLAAVATAQPLDISQISESLGHIIGKNLDQLGVDLDLDAIAKGLKDEIDGEPSPLSEEDCVQAISILQEKKILSLNEIELNKANAISNGDQIQDYEDHSLSASDSSKYW